MSDSEQITQTQSPDYISEFEDGAQPVYQIVDKKKPQNKSKKMFKEDLLTETKPPKKKTRNLTEETKEKKRASLIAARQKKDEYTEQRRKIKDEKINANLLQIEDAINEEDPDGTQELKKDLVVLMDSISKINHMLTSLTERKVKKDEIKNALKEKKGILTKAVQEELSKKEQPVNPYVKLMSMYPPKNAQAPHPH